MAEAGVGHDLTDFDVLCNAACQRYNIEFKNTEVLGSFLFNTMKYMKGEPQERDYAHATLNTHMEIAEEIFEDQEELDKIIANEGRVTSEDTNDGNDNYEPVLTGRSPAADAAAKAAAKAAADAQAAADAAATATASTAAAAAATATAAAAAAAAAAATAADRYLTLLTFVNLLRTSVGFLNNEMISMNRSLTVLCGAQAQVYNNMLFFSTGVSGIRDRSLFPKYSFNILCTKQSSLLPELLVLGGRGVGSILNLHVCNIVRQLRELATPNSIQFKIVNPTDTNKLWQVKICLFGNEFTFISIQIISMSNNFFTLMINPPHAADDELYAISNLCFSLYNKCLSKDFNCLCSLSELDTALFPIVIGLLRFEAFVRVFLDNLIETLPNIKKQYFIMGLYNVASCSSYPNYTPETKAYELLFDRAPDGIDLFNKSMCFIKELNQKSFPAFPEQIRFAMGGGKLYSIFQKALNAVRLSNQVNFNQHIVSVITQLYPNDGTAQWERQRQTLNTELQHASVKAAADADFGCFYPEEGIATGGIGASSCMAICMLLQLSLKQLINGLFAPPAPWNGSEIDIGNSCIGTPPSTLSSLRIVLKNIPRFYTLTQEQVTTLQPYGQYLGDLENIKAIKATISPYDFVMKGSMKSYIVHIFEAVRSYSPITLITLTGIVTPITDEQIYAIAQFLTKYCMVTQEGFSSPIKGILDIFYTLFIIENFANRTFITQKINKELKRVAICAQILLLHYSMLPQDGILPQILPILTAMIGYGYDGSNLLGEQFRTIMETYVGFVSVLCSICLQSPDHLYYSIVPSDPHDIVGIPPINQGTIDRLNNPNSIENKFMNLLPPEQPPPSQQPPQPAQLVYCNGVSSVFANTIAQYTGVITALGTMGPLRPDPLRPDALVQTAQSTTALYQNKLYASCRDAENKKEGVVAIMSAYQAFLWDIRKIDRIRRNQEGDTCYGKVTGYQGIFQCLPTPHTTPTVFDGLFIIISTIVGNVDILDLGDGNRVDEYTFIDATRTANADAANADAANDNARKLFLVFSWFITSVFGVKTKSKSTKVVSIGRTYLQLLRETRVGQGQVSLFGSQITIPAAAAVAAPLAVIDEQIVPEVIHGQQVDTAIGDEPGRLCLAYSSGHIFGMAINKYIKMDIDMIVDAARVTAAAAAVAFDLATAQRAAVDQVSNDVKQVLSFPLPIPQPAAAGEQTQKPVMVYPLSVDIASLVFRKEIFTQLIENLSRVPSGKGNKENAALYMRTIMRRICFCLDTNQIPEINNSMLAIRVFYPYNFDLHNLTKFKNLTNAMKTQWYNYLMGNILNTNLSPEAIFNNMRLLVLLYNCIVFENTDFRYPVLQANLPSYLDAIGPIIDAKFKECQTGDAGGGLLELYWLWKREEPREIAAAAAAAAAASRAEIRANAAVVAAAAAHGADVKQGFIAKYIAKNSDKTSDKRKVNEKQPSLKAVSGARAAGLAATAATIRDAKLKTERNKVKGGGNTNNHTRRNKNKRKKNSKTKTKFKTKSSPKHKKVIPSSRSGSQSNRKKSKPKKSQKNVTFKRRRARK